MNKRSAMRLGLGACALLLLLSGVTVRHAPAQDGSICALLSDDRKRLDCYDLLFKKPQAEKSKPAAPAKPQTAGTGKWQVEEFISKLDDSTNVVVTVSALEPFQTSMKATWQRCRLRAARARRMFGSISRRR